MTEEMLRLLAAQRREKKDLLLCIDRAWGACARQARQAAAELLAVAGLASTLLLYAATFQFPDGI